MDGAEGSPLAKGPRRQAFVFSLRRPEYRHRRTDIERRAGATWFQRLRVARTQDDDQRGAGRADVESYVMADTDVLFEVRTPLGFSVRVTKVRGGS
jgi:hypothetical protein